jgi:hypothetical protein
MERILERKSPWIDRNKEEKREEIKITFSRYKWSFLCF